MEEPPSTIEGPQPKRRAVSRYFRRATGVLFTACSALATADFVAQKLGASVVTSQPAIHPLLFLVLFFVTVMVVALLDSQVRLHHRTSGAEGWPEKLLIGDAAIPTKSSAVLVSFVAGVVLVYVLPSLIKPVSGPLSPATINAESSSTAHATNESSQVTRRSAQPTSHALIIHGHIVTGVNFHQIDSICNRLTTLQCDKIIDTYTGKWVKWSGSVADINDRPGVTLDMPSETPDIPNITEVTFSEDQRDDVVHLRVGDKIMVLGQVGTYGFLSQAEILSNSTANAQSKTL